MSFQTWIYHVLTQKNQTDIIVKGRTIRVIIKRFLELTIL